MTVPNLTFTELRGFHGAFATGVASQQGALTLPDTWFRPQFWDLLMLQLLRPNSSNLPCLYSTFHLEYPLVLSRFYFDYTAVADRLRTVSWSNYGYPTGVINLVYGPNLPTPRNSRVIKRTHI